jgi:hypothetical protein
MQARPNCRSVRDAALVIGQSDPVSDGVNAALVSIVKGMGAALPDDFKRQGRKWVRESDGMRQEVGLRRLMLSYGLNAAIFRLSFIHGIKSRVMSGTDWTTPGRRDWDVGANPDPGELERLIAEVREALPPLVDYLNQRFTPDGYCASIAEVGPPIVLLNAYVGLGRVDEVRTLAASEDIRPNDHQHREGMLFDAEVVIDAYAMLGEDPPGDWQDLAKLAVKSFRGRPPKHVRARWEHVRNPVESWSR